MLSEKLKEYFKDIGLLDILDKQYLYTTNHLRDIIDYKLEQLTPIPDCTPDREYGWYRKFEKTNKRDK